MNDTRTERLMEPQLAAVAKLACGIGRPGSLALLCGPRGVGKTTVLGHLATAVATARSVDLFPAARWLDLPTLPDVVLADDAHDLDEAAIARLVRRCHDRPQPARLVLAGEGRLLTLVARDSRVEQGVRMRVSLPACTAAESRRLLETAVATAAGRPVAVAETAARTAHELAGGMPAAVLRLAELAGVLAASRPDAALSADDLEAVHGRLSLAAA